MGMLLARRVDFQIKCISKIMCNNEWFVEPTRLSMSRKTKNFAGMRTPGLYVLLGEARAMPSSMYVLRQVEAALHLLMRVQDQQQHHHHQMLGNRVRSCQSQPKIAFPHASSKELMR